MTENNELIDHGQFPACANEECGKKVFLHECFYCKKNFCCKCVQEHDCIDWHPDEGECV